MTISSDHSTQLAPGNAIYLPQVSDQLCAGTKELPGRGGWGKSLIHDAATLFVFISQPDHGAPAPPAGTKPDYALQSDSDSDREENGRRKKNLRGLSTTDSEGVFPITAQNAR